MKRIITTTGSPEGKAKSKEQQEYYAAAPQAAGDSGDMHDSSVLDVSPGSLVETRRNNIETLGIVLGTKLFGTRIYTATLMANGEIWEHRGSDITFVLPSYVPLTLAERCGLEGTPENQTQLHARMEVLKRLRTVVRELEEKYNILWNGGNSVYDKLKAQNLSEWAETSVTEVVHMLENTPDYHTVYATHRYMMEDPIHYVARDPYILSQTFDVRPEREVREIEQVMEWKRQANGPLVAFAAKAKPIIAANKEHLKNSAKKAPVMKPTENIWSAEDKVIISFLLNSLRPHRSVQTDPYALGHTAILRLLYPDVPTVEEHLIYDALVNLGAISPWQDPNVLIKSFFKHPEPKQDQEQEALVERSLATRSSVSKKDPLGPEDLYSSDPLESVRHDFGDMRAYVIDDATAKELDDAVSIERIPHEKGSYWIHTHIANPTAVLPPSHILAKRAMKMGTTTYLIHRTDPLFPESITHNPKSGWSLGSSIQSNNPTNVMTFSAKVDEHGNILDYAVRAGLVNKLRIVSYDAVDKMIGYTSEAQRPFGGPLKTTEEPLAQATFMPEEQDELKLLHKLAKGLQYRRVKNGSLAKCSFASQVEFGRFPVGSMTPNGFSRTFQGFPKLIDYVVQSSDYSEKGARGMIGETAKLASRVASRFALEHNVPMVRRSLSGIVFTDEESRVKAMEMRNEVAYIVEHELAVLEPIFPSAVYTMEPKEHAGIGVQEGEGYSRVTSPLRRVLDLVGHWQLHNALLGSKAPTSKPMFSWEWMQQFKSEFDVKERRVKLMSNTHNQLWRTMFLKRWIDGDLRGLGENVPVPPSFTGYILDNGVVSYVTGRTQHTVSIPSLGIRGFADIKNAALGEKVELKFSEIRPGVVPLMSFVKA
ncbi:ribonuclease II [Coprinopsis marcescibilis]|uniref:Ribonuclease II n=1 Tax=Coprinopsis marcescibilis TaxID=230819 RepID=A0A5C3L5F7_COPMA|nr:ribonuclease II [Coprinopsis marcescibilis]